jgi:hypothetical protein
VYGQERIRKERMGERGSSFSPLVIFVTTKRKDRMIEPVYCQSQVDPKLTNSESSLFVAPHLLILKTCGTTLNLLGLHRIIEIAREYCGLMTVWRCFYSRKSFFFPERQQGVHRDWRDEVGFLDSVFGTFLLVVLLVLLLLLLACPLPAHLHLLPWL